MHPAGRKRARRVLIASVALVAVVGLVLSSVAIGFGGDGGSPPSQPRHLAPEPAVAALEMAAVEVFGQAALYQLASPDRDRFAHVLVDPGGATGLQEMTVLYADPDGDARSAYLHAGLTGTGSEVLVVTYGLSPEGGRQLLASTLRGSEVSPGELAALHPPPPPRPEGERTVRGGVAELALEDLGVPPEVAGGRVVATARLELGVPHPVVCATTSAQPFLDEAHQACGSLLAVDVSGLVGYAVDPMGSGALLTAFTRPSVSSVTVPAAGAPAAARLAVPGAGAVLHALYLPEPPSGQLVVELVRDGEPLQVTLELGAELAG